MGVNLQRKAGVNLLRNTRGQFQAKQRGQFGRNIQIYKVKSNIKIVTNKKKLIILVLSTVKKKPQTMAWSFLI